ncbi:MBL fold metallo-hydrolase, partial [bacterium]|nr:MBL fold metallo-hydrolase [bacterium]
VRDHEKTVLIDAGVGTKPRRDFVETYRMEWPRRLDAELKALNVSRDDIDIVILTHLHWDHAGGATRFNDEGIVEPAFPRARYFVQTREWEAAMKAPPDDDSYLHEDFAVLKDAGVLTLFDGNSDVAPGIEVRLTGGHSPGHQIVLIGNPDGQRAAFMGDLIPTAAMLAPETVMSYDIEPNILTHEKQKILREAFENHWLLIFQHAPRQRAGYLTAAEKGFAIEWISL